MSLSYWFTLYPTALTAQGHWWWSIIASVAIIAGALCSMFLVRRSSLAFQQKAWRRVVHFAYVNGVLLWVLLFFRYEGVALLGSRFWLLFLVIGDIVWAVFIVKHLLVRLPAQRKVWEDAKQVKKYI